MGQYGRQNMLRPNLKIWEWELIFGHAVKAISSLGVRSSCCQPSIIQFESIWRSLFHFMTWAFNLGGHKLTTLHFLVTSILQIRGARWSQFHPLLICTGFLKYPVSLEFFSISKYQVWEYQNSISVQTWVSVFENWGN